MTLQDWLPLYQRLCGGLQRKEAPAQMRAYYDALSEFTVGVVAEAVRQACSRTWPPTRPNAGDLCDLAHQLRRAQAAPAAICDVCRGERFTITHCDGWKQGQGQPEPVNRQALCRRDFPHAAHDDAHPCWQCHPAARAKEAAA